VSLIDAYLGFALRRDSPRTFYERRLYLQSFVDDHGFRRVRECKPFHVTSWVDGHAEWKSEWTRATAVRIAQRPFNWGVEQGLIPTNPVALRAVDPKGEPRRPVTTGEYARLRNATRGASGPGGRPARAGGSARSSCSCG
jgi:hypothetical protein